MSAQFQFPICIGCMSKMTPKPELAYTPIMAMQGCAVERLAETKKLYGVPMEKCCVCGGVTIAALYTKEDPRRGLA
ncbi:MAG: hypothetical protein ACLQVI_35580 [Polyangiaceae bacterium]